MEVFSVLNCITVPEPYATAMLFGFQSYIDRKYEIKKGECIIHVDIKPAIPKLKIIEYFNDVGAPITSELFKIALDKTLKETEHFYISSSGIEARNNIDFRSPDYHMAECLFFRNKISDRRAPFLFSRKIGTVIFTHSEQINKKNSFLIRNHCEKSQIFSLKNSTFDISRLGQFDSSDNYN